MHEIRGCFFCNAPKVQQFQRRKRIWYRCLQCGKISARFRELAGRTKVKKTARGLIHFSAGAIIELDGRYLIMKRATYPFLYATVGGHVDKGETMARALTREVKEETGLTIKTKKFIFQGLLDHDSCSRGVDRHFWNLFLVRAQGTLKRKQKESTRLRWYTKAQMKRLRFTTPVEYIFRKIHFFSDFTVKKEG